MVTNAIFINQVAFCTTFHAKFAPIIPPENIMAFSPATDALDFLSDRFDETANTFAKPNQKAVAWSTRLIAINAAPADSNVASPSA